MNTSLPDSERAEKGNMALKWKEAGKEAEMRGRLVLLTGFLLAAIPVRLYP